MSAFQCLLGVIYVTGAENGKFHFQFTEKVNFSISKYDNVQYVFLYTLWFLKKYHSMFYQHTTSYLFNHNMSSFYKKCNTHVILYTWKKVREHLLCYEGKLWTIIFLQSKYVLEKSFS